VVSLCLDTFTTEAQRAHRDTEENVRPRHCPLGEWEIVERIIAVARGARIMTASFKA